MIASLYHRASSSSRVPAEPLELGRLSFRSRGIWVPVSTRSVCAHGLLQSEYLRDALQRHDQPIRPIVQLVDELVNRLFHEEGIQKDAHFLPRLGYRSRAASGLHIGA